MSRDWGGLGAIIKEAQAIVPLPLVACPRCGTPLQRNSRGQVNCPLGHFFAESDR
jgi:hypothetical protein